jgi:DNA-binding CsgD family transcriptional regulator
MRNICRLGWGEAGGVGRIEPSRRRRAKVNVVVEHTVSGPSITDNQRPSARDYPAPGVCAACGAYLPRVPDQHVPAIVVRAALPQPMAAALVRISALAPRERTVFHLLGFGFDNRSIAREMKVSERTVKRYVTVILAKLGLESRLQAGLTALIVFSSSPSAATWPKGRIDPDQAGSDNG